MGFGIRVDGREIDVLDDGASLLEVLRDRLGLRTVKDGCSPQGQCGCCTVLVDGAPRVACVTPARRVAGRAVTTLDGLPEQERQRWAAAFCQAGASQCGFCTPGIIMRLAASFGEGGLSRSVGSVASVGPGRSVGSGGAGVSSASAPAGLGREQVETALLAHLCRCTGWRTIVSAATQMPAADPARDLAAAVRRATLEGGTAQRVGPDVALGYGGFADDLAPADALVAVPDGAGGWAVAETLSAARAAAAVAGKVQGRRSGTTLRHPVEVPPGDWAVTLRTTWVEPAYLEPDASWCRPGGEPATPLGNGGAFGGKLASIAPAAARRLADRYRRPVRVLLSREDVVRLGPKRPPVGAGVRSDGTGVLRLAGGPGHADAVGDAGVAAVAAVAAVAPGLRVEQVVVPGPPTSMAPRAAVWAEAAVLVAAVTTPAGSPVSVTSPAGATASAMVRVDGAGLPVGVAVRVECGDPLDEIVLRSYAVGAAHMALSWVCSEGIAVDDAGVPQDLTIRSFGILRARDTPEIDVTIDTGRGPAVPGSDAVFAAVAAATWIAQGRPQDWPTRRGRFG